MTSFLLAALAAASSTGAVPVPPENPDILVVEGTRLDQTLREAGTAITLIDEEELRRRTFLLDAIATAPGVTINQSGGFGGAATVRIRGASSDQTLVLVDGVPVGDSSGVGGGFDFARLDVSQIEKVEILKGPQATLWGSEAIGGVVSITTKDAGTDGFSAFAEAGSFSHARGGAALTRSRGDAGFRLGVTGIATDGISKADEDAGNTEDDGYRAATLSAAGRAEIAGTLFRASALYQDAETEFDGFSFGAPGSVADADERAETEELTLSLSAERGDRERGVAHRLLAGHSQIDRDNFANAAPSFDAFGRRSTLRYQASTEAFGPLALSAGGELDHREAEGRAATIASLFSLAEISPTDRLTATFGLRIDDHDGFGSETTARAALAYRASDALSLRASWGEGFKAPSLFQETFACCGAAGPNTDLGPERSEGWDAGVLYADGPLRFEVGYFDLETEDLIDFAFEGIYVNIAEARTRGVEASGAYRLTGWLEASASYTFIEAEGPGGAPLARVPEHSADAALSFTPDGPWAGSVLLRYNGEEEDAFGTVGDWLRLDANLTYALDAGTEVYARAENLTDTDYQQVFGYGTPGRSGIVGVRLRY